MDIPRIFTVSESEHRIHNPFTPEKYATLGRVLRMKPDTRILDLGSGSGEMLCTWARDHGITGTGIDMSPLFTTQAKLRAEELGVAERVQFFHNDAAGYVADEKCDVAACIGATWIAGGVAGTMSLLAQSLKRGESCSSANLTGGGFPQRMRWLGPVAPRPSQTFSPCPTSSPLSIGKAMTWWKWCWPTRKAGTDTKPRNG
jgi:SAM-dependent methyltransferase